MNSIKKINKYLVENYPLIWNTRLLWMFGVNILIHLLFFIMGYFTVGNIEDLKSQFNLTSFYSDTSVVHYNILISILTLLVWIVLYLRNNAFKHFYRIQEFALFKEFCIIVIIIFMSCCQYFSFMEGLKLKVRQSFDWEEINKDIKVINRTAIFLVQDYDAYKINNKKYPKPFPLKVAVENENNKVYNIDTTKVFINHKGFNYQFYRLNEKLIEEEQVKNYYTDYVYDFRYRIVEDVSTFKDHIDPTLLNYSKVLYAIGQDSLDFDRQLESHKDILTAGNTTRIKEELQVFIDLSNKYEVDHNLTVEKWFPLVDNTPIYTLTELIRPDDPKKNGYNNRSYSSYSGEYNRENTASIPYSKTLYSDLGNLDNFFKNVYHSYYPVSEMDFFSFLIGMVIFFGLILFIFKTTSLKSLLLSIVATIVLLVLIVLLMAYTDAFRILGGRNSGTEHFIIIFVTSIVIASSIVSFILRWKKLMISVLLSLALYAFPLFFLFNVLLYMARLRNIHGYEYQNGFTKWFEAYGFWAIMVIWMVGIFIYSLLIKKLRARPE